MGKYLLIESRDPFTCQDVATNLEVAGGLAAQGNEVTLFLVQNGVLPARPGEASKAYSQVAKSGVRVLADEFSLRERGISAGRLAAGITSSPLDFVIDEMLEGSKTIWH